MLKLSKSSCLFLLLLSILAFSNAYSQKLGIVNMTKEEIQSMPKGSIDAKNLQTLADNVRAFYSQKNPIQYAPQGILQQNNLNQLQYKINMKNLQNPTGVNIGANVYINKANNTPYFISNISYIANQKINSPKLQTASIPINYVNENKSLFQLKSPDKELKFASTVKSNDGNLHITYHQYYNEIPIWGKELIFHLDNNDNIYLFTGRYVPTPSKIDNSGYAISSDDAITKCKGDLQNQVKIEKINPQLATLLKYTGPQADKYIWTDEGNQSLRYAWVVNIRPNIIDNWYYFIDAETGKILEKYNATAADGKATAKAIDLKGVQRDINVYQESGKYLMIDASRQMYNNNPNDPKGIIFVMDNKSTDLVQTSKPDIVSSTNNQWTDRTSVSAQYNMGLIYEWYTKNLGRNSFDNAGGSMMTMIHVTDQGKTLDNAYWNGQFVVLGDGGIITSSPWAKALDFHAHEFTHAIVTFTVDLEYKTQSGALNEAFADWGGCMVDREDWQLGEDITNSQYFPSGFMRDMANPHNQGVNGDYAWQPANMSEYQNLTLDNDNGGVHINCGIINKATYLIGTALGREKLEKIYYRVLSQKYVTKQGQFIDFRLACVKAAGELYGNSSSEVQSVKSAFDQVGITDGSGTDPSPDLSPVQGNQYIAFVDASYNYLWIGKTQVSNVNTDVQNLTNTGVYTKNGCVITIPDNGSIILFVDKSNFVRGIYPDGTGEQVLSQTGEYRTIAISPNGRYLAVSSVYTDPNVYIIDLSNGQTETIALYVLNTSQSNIFTEPLFPNSLTWNIDGRTLLYDAVNYSIDYWNYGSYYMELNAIDVPTQTIYRVFPPMDNTISIGAPSFAHNDQNHLVFQVYNSSTDQSFINGVNLFTGDLANIVYATGSQINFSSPNYSTQDNRIVFQAYIAANQSYTIQQIALKSDKITPSGSTVAYLTGVGIPYWFAIGTRSSVEDQDITQSSELIYPNPAQDFVNAPSYLGWEYRIFDLIGNCVQSGTVESDKININGLSAGFYTVRFFKDGKQAVEKLVKE